MLGRAKADPAPPELSMIGGTAELDTALSPRRKDVATAASWFTVDLIFYDSFSCESSRSDPFYLRLLM